MRPVSINKQLRIFIFIKINQQNAISQKSELSRGHTFSILRIR